MKEMLDQFGDYVEKSQDEFCLHALYSYRVVYYKGIGDYDEAEKIGLEGLKCTSGSNDLFNLCCMYNEIASVYTSKGNYRKAMEYLELSKELVKTNNFIPQYAYNVYIYLAECYISQYLDNKDSLPKLQKRIFFKKLKNECSKAIKETKGLPTLYASALKTWANYCAIVNKNIQAEIYFKKAIKLCEKIKLRHVLAITLLDYGIFLKTINRKTEAEVNLRNARDILENIGDKVHSKICTETLTDYSNNLMDSTERFSQSIRLNQRMSLIIRLNHEISSLLNLELLLQKIISVAIEVTGAQNCYILLFYNDVIISNSDDITQDKRTLISQSIINKVQETGEIILSTNAIEDPNLCTFDSIIRNNVKSVLCMPIKRTNEIIGICYLDNNLSGAVFGGIIIAEYAEDFQLSGRHSGYVRHQGCSDLDVRKHFFVFINVVEMIQKLLQNFLTCAFCHRLFDVIANFVAVQAVPPEYLDIFRLVGEHWLRRSINGLEPC
jgi:tetratricopeptide (TPR) repeat protein